MKKTTEPQREWLKVLSKGMVTIPKPWRIDLGIKPGERVMAEKGGGMVVIRPRKRPAPYRVYSKDELLKFVKNDQLTEKKMT